MSLKDYIKPNQYVIEKLQAKATCVIERSHRNKAIWITERPIKLMQYTSLNDQIKLKQYTSMKDHIKQKDMSLRDHQIIIKQCLFSKIE